MKTSITFNNYKQFLSKLEKSDIAYITDNILEIDLPENSFNYSCMAGEDLKSFKNLEKALDFFLSHGVTRNTHIVAIGGGSVSDFAGLVASLLLRGISWSIIPTTLLSMVDASIGGKTAINTQSGKNLVGTFHLPESICIDTSFLKTLSREEELSGRGEILKYCFLDKKIYEAVLDNKDLRKIIELCAHCKSKIVEKDINEGHLRKILNLGHTFGHAIEKDLRIPHGVAVAHGIEIILEMYGSVSMKSSFKNLVKKLELKHLDRSYMPSHTDLFHYLKNDKKMVKKGLIDLIIPKDIGDIAIERRDLTVLESDYKKVAK